ncbi:bifunctional phosphopantothenoylcysteine decarboxylase/phosphopantothenate--cysteine ligase CoaBC [Desulfurococcus mucosus]|uniref:Coenzyme A biosynthesis bifunctional protein CoaBC n=1 Tax=Desulfurococcus mucosus (strain ATCC 35584 / DSM 2162 / JCM 9187 / O7/1) TaxID=765177 RepID=E8R970_DESM0|nr:bifunctional phosphopantothenoylcysteine decarboxylase/phosphopantothenate--cysteine ligase CoaBC [Desulfurococcus mucosus]ADV65046.1 Phosphopantothenoylcysteine decarboxylase; Phosphopantothenate-cysteine ligase [Desulfurococcus mucosus DSM 2162]
MTEEITRYLHQPLQGRNLVLGLTASSSIYKSIDLARRLIRMGGSVRVVLTKRSLTLIGPDLVHWATGSKPFHEMSGETEHIDLARWGDAMIIAPATLNTMAKIAGGVLDELLTLTAVTMMGSGKKVMLVPAMNLRLMNSPQYKRITGILEEYGAIIVPPMVEEDKAKYPPLDDLSHCIDAVVNRGLDLRGRRVLVTAGPTREHIDPVRVITNPSSGLMGVLVARELACRGASVDLVHGPMAVKPPYTVRAFGVESASEMADKIRELTSIVNYDAAVFAAAPADYKPATTMQTKISTREKPVLELRLEPTPKTIRAIVKRPRVLVAFAAETCGGEELVERALHKAADYGADLVVGNNVSSSNAGFGKDMLDVVMVSEGKVLDKGYKLKAEVARVIGDFIASRLHA